jgi:serine protease Do/serine protease DegQ
MINKTRILAILFLSVTSFCANAALPLQVDGENLPSLSPMLERSMPAVVNISTSINTRMQENPLMNDPVFRHFFGVPRQQQQRRNSLGSGVIIDKDQGYVLTNNHVIDKADVITVTLSDSGR